MTPISIESDRATPPGRFVEHAYRMRVFGLCLGFACVASVLYQNEAQAGVWALFAINGILWPPLARILALRSRDPKSAEMRNLLIDSAMGGVWIALMKFNLLPSVLLALALALGKVNIGGWRLLARSLAVQMAACILALAIHGMAFVPQTTMLNVVASLPLLIGYPLAMSVYAWSLTRTLNEQRRQLRELRGETAPRVDEEPSPEPDFPHSSILAPSEP